MNLENTNTKNENWLIDLDENIRPVVKLLNEHGFKTFESCEGGEGHCFNEPTVRFEGNEYDLMRAFEICRLYNLPVLEGHRVFRKAPVYVNDNTPNVSELGEIWDVPFNELVFLPFLEPIIKEASTKTSSVE